LLLSDIPDHGVANVLLDWLAKEEGQACELGKNGPLGFRWLSLVNH